jgi:acyl-coenzyme A thioesterase PaaI-like protein
MGTSRFSFFDIVQHPLKFRLFLFTKLPAAFFSGVRISYADENKAVATVPYKWFTKNPFRSTYFACLGMAAEMTTGLLAMAQVYKQQPATSMLIIKSEASFIKKATGTTRFTCEDGPSIKQAIKEAMSSGKETSVAARSVGVDKDGNIIAEFIFTWSFKVKQSNKTS